MNKNVGWIKGPICRWVRDPICVWQLKCRRKMSQKFENEFKNRAFPQSTFLDGFERSMVSMDSWLAEWNTAMRCVQSELGIPRLYRRRFLQRNTKYSCFCTFRILQDPPQCAQLQNQCLRILHIFVSCLWPMFRIFVKCCRLLKCIFSLNFAKFQISRIWQYFIRDVGVQLRCSQFVEGAGMWASCSRLSRAVSSA